MSKTIKQFEAEVGTSTFGLDQILSLRKQVAHLTNPKDAKLLVPSEAETIFGVVSCTHFGSLYANIKGLEAFYKHAKKEGAKFMLHCGDVCDGHKMYKGQEFEQEHLGWEDQASFFEDNAPGDIPTKFITGNHDESLKKLAGLSPGTDLARRRKDWEFIGSCSGKLVLDAGKDRKCKLELMHPGGGSAYALSYKLQKIIEQLEGGTKPDMLFVGHFHKAITMPTYRNIYGTLAGTFQWQTPFMRDLGLAAHVGGWLIKVKMGVNCNTFSSEFVAFYR